jgi:GH15 family glucan-1,4-alpha-glucosidase
VERSAFPPIADLAFLSDCELGALVAPSGNVEWLCLPRFDSPSVFGSILDRESGHFRWGPADANVPSSRRYVPGTLILETTWRTRTGWLVVRDALAVGPWHHVDRRSHRQRRAPADWESDHVLVRTARCVEGIVELLLECEPSFEYGAKPVEWEYTTSGYHDARGKADGSDIELQLSSDLRVGFEGSRVSARTTLRRNETAFVAVAWSDYDRPKTFHDAFVKLDHTASFWREVISRGEVPDHPWRTVLARSALTLKGLTYTPTGAIVSAPTTSLPRVPRGRRNYDSRYTFVRDAAFALQGAYSLGYDWDADDFFYFLADQADDTGALQNIYGVGGERDLTERELPNLDGYDGARPVRIGNDAYNYDQHDVWGVFIEAAYLHATSRDKLPERIWPIVKRQVELAVQNWRKPDRGIWASRGEPRHYVSSKVFCWVAADRGARLARLRDDYALAEQWEKTAEEIRDDVLENGVDARGVFTAHYETDALDASVLLIPITSFMPASDHRVRKTVLAIGDELMERGVILRRRPEREADFVGEVFLVCSFWFVSALSEIGENARAREMMERLLSYVSPLGLYAEHLDPNTGRHLGNFPHAFTHLALVTAAMRLIRAEEPALRFAS